MSAGQTTTTELIELRDLHRDYFVALARSLEKSEDSDTWADFQARFATLDAEAANLRAAIAWSEERSDPSLRPLVLALCDWFVDRGSIREARQAIDRALALDGHAAETVDLLLRAASLNENADEAEALRRRAVEVARTLDDREPLLRARSTASAGCSTRTVSTKSRPPCSTRQSRSHGASKLPSGRPMCGEAVGGSRSVPAIWRSLVACTTRRSRCSTIRRSCARSSTTSWST